MAAPAYGRFPRPVPDPGPERLLFDDFELRLESRELFRGGRPLKLQDQPARLLVLLASRPGQLVGRDEIQRHLWGDEVNVDFDQSINFCVKQLRRTLDDSAARPRFVETVPRRGYRFVAPVRRAAVPEDEIARPLVQDAPDDARGPGRWAMAWIAAGLAVAAAVYLAVDALPRRAAVPGGPRPTADDLPPAAREAYLEGVFLLEKEDADPVGARAALEQAVRLAPDFAPAHSWLAEATLWSPDGTEAAAQAAVERAIELDPGLAEARVVLGRLLFYRKYDWEGSGRELRLAVELDPELARAHHQYAGWLSSQGRHDEALAAAERARSLDPGSLLLAADVGLFAYFARRWDRAIAESRRVLALDPDYVWAHRWIIFAATARGSPALALEQAKAEIAAVSSRSGAAPPEPDVRTLEGYWQWQLSRFPAGELERFPGAQIAMIYLGSGDRERALEHLGRVCEQPAGWRAPYLAVHPFFDPLRSEPRFREVLDCLGLSGVSSQSGKIPL